MHMPRGSSPKREQEYETLKHAFKQDHRYPGREEEVAARIVNKQRKQAGEPKDNSSWVSQALTYQYSANVW